MGEAEVAKMSCILYVGEFLDLETGILEFCICVLLGVKLNGRLGEDFNPGFNNHFKHSEKKIHVQILI